MAHDHIEVAVSADLLEEPHMAGVDPIVTAGHDYPLATGCGGRLVPRALRKPAQVFLVDHLVADASRLATSSAARRILAFIHYQQVRLNASLADSGDQVAHIDFRLWTLDFGLPDQHHLPHKSDCSHDIRLFGF